MTAAGVVGAATVAPIAAAQGGALMAPGVNPVYLTGSTENWPLAEIAAAGCGSLEITADSLVHAGRWKSAADKAGLQVVAVNAMPELRPYLTGSLVDGVAWRRTDTLKRLTATLKRMQDLGAPYLIVASNRLAENYQTIEQLRVLLLDALKELSDAAGTVTVLLEGAPFRRFGAPEQIAAVLDDLARPNLAAALNIGHLALQDASLPNAVKTLGARLRYVQVHDADVRPGYPRLDRHLPLGQGSLKAKDARAAIGDRPYALTICAPDDPLGALRSAVKWLQG